MANWKCQKFRVGQTVRHRTHDIELGPMVVVGYDEGMPRLVWVRNDIGEVRRRFEFTLMHDYGEEG